MAVIVQVIIALLIAGFIFWAGRKLLDLLPLDAMFKQVIDVLLIILAAAIILFMAVIPMLHMLVGISVNVSGFH